MNKNLNHPEQLPGEIFFTNASARQFRMMRWETKRRGRVAYDEKGRITTHKNYFPVFLQTEELEAVKSDLTTERKTWKELMDQLNIQPY